MPSTTTINSSFPHKFSNNSPKNTKPSTKKSNSMVKPMTTSKSDNNPFLINKKYSLLKE
jgi:hypothetical protein